MCLGKVIALQVTVMLPVVLNVCGPQAARGETDVELKSRAQRLAQKLLIIDTHLDTPYEVRKTWYDISTRAEKGYPSSSRFLTCGK